VTVLRDEMLGRLAEMVSRSGWALQGVFGDTVESVFTYTVGLTEAGLPELWLGSLDPRQAGAVLNGLAVMHLAAAADGGLPVGEPVDCEFSVRFRLRGPVQARAGETFAAFQMYGEEAVSLLQVLWPDAAGKYPDEWGYDHAAFPQRLLPPVVGQDAGMTPAESTPSEVTVTETTTVPVEPTAEVAVELPAKTVETVEVDATPETAASDGQPDPATEAMAVHSDD
jgi:hypothetical protein